MIILMPEYLDEKAGFESEESLRAVRAKSGEARKDALAQWKESYVAQRSALAESQVAILKRLREKDKPEATKEDLRALFQESAGKEGFSRAQERVVLAALDIVEERRKIIRAVRERFPDDRELFQAVFGVTPIGHVRVEQNPIHLNFVCSNRVDLYRTFHFQKTRLSAFFAVIKELLSSSSKGGTFEEHVNMRLPDLNGMVVVVDESNKDMALGDVRVHEEQHMIRRIIRASVQKARAEEDGSREQTPETRLVQEYKDVIENDIADELLALNKGGVRTTSNIMASSYFLQIIGSYTGALQEQISRLKKDDEPATDKGISRTELEYILRELNSRAYQEKLWEETKEANIAYGRLVNIGGRSHEEVTALLEVEPLRRWRRLEIMIQGPREAQAA